jgi:hypothetical protein
MKRQVDLEFGSEILGEDFFSDAHLVNEDEPIDTFEKVYRDVEHGIDRQALDTSLADVHSAIDSHYKKLAQAVTSSPEAKVTDPQALAKRFSQPDPKSAYREYFREQTAKGLSADEILAAWCEEFPHRNPSVEKLMRETAAEFV